MPSLYPPIMSYCFLVTIEKGTFTADISLYSLLLLSISRHIHLLICSVKYTEELLSPLVVTIVPYGAAVLNQKLISCKKLQQEYC